MDIVKCPVCLAFNETTEAEVIVNGTHYCGQHGVEALRMSAIDPRGPQRGSIMSQFQPPAAAQETYTVPPAPPTQ